MSSFIPPCGHRSEILYTFVSPVYNEQPRPVKVPRDVAGKEEIGVAGLRYPQPDTRIRTGPMTDVFETFDIFDPSAAPNRSRADFVYESLRDAISDGRIPGGGRVREEEEIGRASC